MLGPAVGRSTGRKGWWTDASTAFANLLFPWSCPVCDAEQPDSASPFCDDCRAELIDAAGPSCVRCAMPVGPYSTGCRECKGRSLGFDAAFALGPYQGPLRALCLKLKHESGAWLARWLAEVLAEARPTLRAQALAAPDALIVPVPLHWRRHWSRGYNQSEELARGLALRLGLKTAQPLKRVRHTVKLAGLGRSDRVEALRGAFHPRRSAAGALKGRTVFLVDDVLTTGATCASAARALKRAGAKRVVAVVIARAEGRV